MSDAPAVQQDESPPPPESEGAPLWVVTFGDMMSLLLTFFILMFSMSELKVDRFLLASESLRDAMGGTAAVASEDAMGLMPDPVDPDLHLSNPGDAEVRSRGEGDPELTTLMSGNSWVEDFSEAYLQTVAERLEDFIDENELNEAVEVLRDGDGVHLRIQDVALFEPGAGVINKESRWILGVLSEITASIDLPVVVSGHADNRPINNGQFASNWELSAARAAGVARALVAGGQDPMSVRVESYGEYRPVASNDTREGRARNRRVELFYAYQEAMDWARTLMDGGEEGESAEGETAAQDVG